MRGNTSAPRRVHVLCIAALAALATSIALALAAKPAQAAPVQVTGFETRLEVNVSNFVKILSAGIFPTAIPPAASNTALSRPQSSRSPPAASSTCRTRSWPCPMAAG